MDIEELMNKLREVAEKAKDAGEAEEMDANELRDQVLDTTYTPAEMNSEIERFRMDAVRLREKLDNGPVAKERRKDFDQIRDKAKGHSLIQKLMGMMDSKDRDELDQEIAQVTELQRADMEKQIVLMNALTMSWMAGPHEATGHDLMRILHGNFTYWEVPKQAQVMICIAYLEKIGFEFEGMIKLRSDHDECGCPRCSEKRKAKAH